MLEILSTYSLGTLIVVFIAVMIFAKQLIELIEFFVKKIKSHYDKNQEIEISRKEILDMVEKVSENINTIIREQASIRTDLESQQDQLDLLIDSDKDQLKSLIVNRYHHFIAKGWIDDFSMDSLEKNFQHYEDEGGNSYIHDLMDELRHLPHAPKN